jgi:hypothetical protein
VETVELLSDCAMDLSGVHALLAGVVVTAAKDS